MVRTPNRPMASATCAGSVEPTLLGISGGSTHCEPSSRSRTPTSGKVISEVCGGTCPRAACTCSTMADRLPWVISTALAGPVLPVVNAIISRSSSGAGARSGAVPDGWRPQLSKVAPPQNQRRPTVTATRTPRK